MWSALGVLIACVLSAILYRAGGMSKDSTAKPTWMPMWMRESWVRDWLCPGVFGLLMLTNFTPVNITGWVAFLLYYGLSGAFLSTYWDFTGKDNFYLHGLGCSLATIPLFWCGVPWWILLIHGIICTLGMGWISEKSDTDWVEEFGRGIFYIL